MALVVVVVLVKVALWMGTRRGVILLELGGRPLVVQTGDRRCFSDERLGGVDSLLRGRRGREGAAVTMGLERVWISEPWLFDMDGSFVGGHFLSLLFCLSLVCYRVKEMV